MPELTLQRGKRDLLAQRLRDFDLQAREAAAVAAEAYRQNPNYVTEAAYVRAAREAYRVRASRHDYVTRRAHERGHLLEDGDPIDFMTEAA